MSKELQKNNAGSLAFIKPEDCKGIDNIDQEDMLIPNVYLVQKTSSVIDDNDQLKSGDLIDNISLEVIQADKFVVIKKLPNHWTRRNALKPEDAGWIDGKQINEFIWSTTDRNDPRVQKEGTFQDGKKPLAVYHINFLVLFENETMPKILSFAKANTKEGKKLGSMLIQRSNAHQNAPSYAFKFSITSKQTETNGHKYYVLVINNAGNVTADEYVVLKDMANQFKTQEVSVVDVTTEPEDTKETVVTTGSENPTQDDIPF